MMFGARISVSGEIELLSTLHVGGADDVEYQEEGESRHYSPLVRDHEGQVILPAAGLKGVLRAALAQGGADAAAYLGEPTLHAEGEGRAARLWLDNAVMTSAPGDDKLADLSAHPPSGGTFRVKHVAIDRTTGAARDNHLYEREQVAAGAVFSFRAEWLGGRDTLDDLASALSPLANGLAIGRATSKGMGQIRLDPSSLALSEHAPCDDGSLADIAIAGQELGAFQKSVAAATGTAGGCRIILTLVCEGPFLSVRKVDAATGTPDDGPRNTLLPLKQAGCPVLWPESLIGALRAQAAWQAERERSLLPKGETPARPEDIPMDDPKLEIALDGARRIRTAADIPRLSKVERLFGVTGKRADLTLRTLTCTNPGLPLTLTSNSIDRLTGATRTGALFKTESVWQPEFEAELNYPKDGADAAFLKGFMESLDGDTLELGHGAARGYGWFKVKVTAKEDAHDE